MRDLDPTACFERFRREGDPAALAYVFDRTAADLLRVAKRLTRSTDAAEDLLQSTFVAAIEGRGGFDATRRVEAWLIGILIKQAGLAWRKATRNQEVERLPMREEADPHDVACAAEIRHEVARAIRTLPAVYRQVLEPKLERGARGVEIAHAVGRTPSVVRAQIHRGLELLRQVLPPGLASLLLLSVSTRRSLAAVRDRVAEHAIASLGLPPSAIVSVPASAILGGIVMFKKLAVAALVLVALGVTWYLGSGAEPGAVEVAEPGRTPPALAVTNEPMLGSVEVPAAAVRVDADPADADLAPGDTGPPESFTRHLSGLRGRLVEADGTPIADTALVARQVHPDSALGLGADPWGADGGDSLLELGVTRTDAAGRFAVSGIRAQGLIALLVDPGGVRAALRLLDVDPPRGAVSDVGDVVLAPAGSLVGVVLDENGEPVAGARVRAGQLQTLVMLFGLQHYRSGDGFAILLPLSVAASEGPLCGDVPAWADRLIREALPAVQTGPDGRFALPRISAGSQNVMVDAPGRVALEKTVRCVAGRENDAGDLRIETGDELRGRVVDASGGGIPQVEVRVGCMASMPMGAVMRPVGPTDAAGRFAVANAPTHGAVLLAVRRAAHHPWQLVGPLPIGGVPDIRLADAVDRSVRCVDARGDAVSDVELAIAPAGAQSDPLSGRPAWVIVAADDADRAAGILWLRDLPEGTYRLRARSRAHGLVEGSLAVPEGAEQVTLVFGTSRAVEVRVIDADTSSPVAWAKASLHAQPGGAVSFHGRTDAVGRVALGPIAAPGGEAYALRVEHPGYARAIERVVPADEPVTVALRAGGEVRGRVLDGGAAPAEPLNVTLRLADDEPGFGIERHMPWVQRLGDDGGFAFDSLPAGRFVVTVDVSHIGQDGLALFSTQIAEPRATATVEVVAARVTQVDLDISRNGGTGAIRGSVRLDGGAADRFVVLAHCAGETLRANTDASGRFELDGVPAGAVRLSIGRPVKVGATTLADLFLHRDFALQPEQVLDLEFAFTTIDVAVLVIDRATGAPRAGVTVELQGVDSATQGLHDQQASGSAGVAALSTFVAGEYLLIADDPQVGRGSARVDLQATAGSEPIRIELDPGVPCAGRFVLPPGFSVGTGAAYEIEVSSGEFERAIEGAGDDLTFDIRGAGPGTYEVLLYATDSGKRATGTFDLAETGRADLVVTLEAVR